jgi:hypothetical protein
MSTGASSAGTTIHIPSENSKSIKFTYLDFIHKTVLSTVDKQNRRQWNRCG